ncbi:c-type cytochrome [Acidocella aminolytica]|jgi:cytochrome c553|uniref:c-type cytochrome n=1 Tax=Acidocella aminolytica TaxID=33998 RepID=UPI00091431F2|nr:c-type cytochrome [Acidocella aminolytica]SHF31073.1 Cytochrome c [Acidocella aminolytica 101 = DSM 11237]
MKLLSKSISTAILTIFLPCAAHAESWPPNGQAIAERGIPPDVPACASCHGAGFNSTQDKGAPSLQKQSATDLMDRLDDEATNPKNTSEMTNIARHLNMAQRAAVTAYIARITQSEG